MSLALLVCSAFPGVTRGQAILVEAYLDSAGEAAATEPDTRKAARLYALALTGGGGPEGPPSSPRASARRGVRVHIQMSQFAEATDNVKTALAIYEQLPGRRANGRPSGRELDGHDPLLPEAATRQARELLFTKLLPMVKAEEGEDTVLLGIVLNDLALVGNPH